MSTVIKDKVESDPEEEARLERIKRKPDVTECFNLLDFEVFSPVLNNANGRPSPDKS